MENPKAVPRHDAIITLSAAFPGKNDCNNIATLFLKMSVNGASTTFGLVSWKILGLCGGMMPELHYRQPF